jgi:hypothetical protein
MKVERLFPIPLEDCAGPQGMTIGPDDQILEGCNANSPSGHRNSVVVDGGKGKIVTLLQDLGGADQVWFNPGDGHYIIPSCNTACRNVPGPFVLTFNEVLGIIDANTLQKDRTVFVASKNIDNLVTSGNPRTVHSVAAGGSNNAIILPIPACSLDRSAGGCGNVPHFTTSLCDRSGAGITVVNSPDGTPPSTAVGCIAILAAVGAPSGSKTKGTHTERRTSAGPS